MIVVKLSDQYSVQDEFFGDPRTLLQAVSFSVNQILKIPTTLSDIHEATYGIGWAVIDDPGGRGLSAGGQSLLVETGFNWET